MKEQLISFETAKLAKEKGLPQDNFYFEDYEARVPFYGLDNELNKGDEDRFGQCKSISQSLLQKWLREKHKIHIYLFPLDNNKWGFENNSISINLDYIFINYMYEGKEYNSYEEALEVGLQEALNFINSDLFIDNEG